MQRHRFWWRCWWRCMHAATSDTLQHAGNRSQKQTRSVAELKAYTEHRKFKTGMWQAVSNVRRPDHSHNENRNRSGRENQHPEKTAKSHPNQEGHTGYE